jgi:hypothetical protein
MWWRADYLRGNRADDLDRLELSAPTHTPHQGGTMNQQHPAYAVCYLREVDVNDAIVEYIAKIDA